MRTLRVDLPDDLEPRLAAIARRQGRALRDVVRDALALYVMNDALVPRIENRDTGR
ncbi:hypothetical protein [Aurantimonas sp. VKM B-3413]|uniref:hypothetical protein n=1 Tax=Aurantimonas sp. VKM B-3413 TaxID=2779401 RepID=UPI001E59E999|nr:hypothetical protein [Aurantimonas sp. VKM B-3413]MCB8840241.1 hypothetical protein [Aurantimonas sp. VKM B-3413]